MNYVNNYIKGKMRMIYSTTSQYFESVLKSGEKCEILKYFDFFPYADNTHWMDWNFSSRSNLKGLIKQLGLYINITTRLLFEIYTGEKEKIKKKYKNYWKNYRMCLFC